jgi:hypothetical protein
MFAVTIRPIVQFTLLLLMFLDLSAAVRNPPDAIEERSANRHNTRDLRQGIPCERWKSRLLEFRLEAEFFEWNTGNVEYRGATNILLTVDPIDVFRWFCFHAFERLSNEIIAIAKFCCARGTRFGTRRLLTLDNSVVAEHAFLNARIRTAPLVPGHLERTRLHAITASNALVLVVENRAFRCFLKRANRTNGCARGVDAVLAHSSDEHAIMFLQSSVGCRGEGLFLSGSQFVCRLACFLAGIAADAERYVDEHCFAFCHVCSLRVYRTWRNSSSKLPHTSGPMCFNAPATGGPPSWRRAGTSSPSVGTAANTSRRRRNS